jgi:hypothetical protein
VIIGRDKGTLSAQLSFFGGKSCGVGWLTRDGSGGSDNFSNIVVEFVKEQGAKGV